VVGLLEEFDWNSLPRDRLLVFMYLRDERGAYGGLRGYFEKSQGQFIIVRRPLGDPVYLDKSIVRRIEVA